MGIDRLVIYMGDRIVVDPGRKSAGRTPCLPCFSHWHHAPSFVCMSARSTEASLREIDQLCPRRTNGRLKLWVATRCDSPEADVLSRAAELKAVVFQHT
jgi:hypothetical protein